MSVAPAFNMIYKLDPQGYFTYVSKSLMDYLGRKESAIKGQHFSSLVAEVDQARVQAFYEKQIAEEQKSSYLEFAVEHPSQGRLWVAQSVEMVFNQKGTLEEVVATAQDITARRKAQESNKRNELRLRQLIDKLNAAILVEDETRHIVHVNQEFCKLFEIPLSPDAMEGMDCSQSAEASKELFVDPRQFVKRIDEILKDRQEVLGERMEMRSGRILERDYIPLFMEGAYAGHLWQYRDITAQQHYEAKLRESEDRYRNLIDNMELGLLEVDLDQKILFANATFCAMTGFNEQDLLGNRADELLLPPQTRQEQGEKVEEHNQERKQGEASVYELEIMAKNGESLFVLISGAPVMNDRNEVTGSLGIHMDISDRKRRELNRQELLADLQKANDGLQTEQRKLQKTMRKKEAAEQALRASEEQLSTILNSAMDAVITIDEHGLVQSWNNMAEKVFGYRAEEVKAQRLSDYIIPEKYRAAHEQGMAHFMATGEGPVLNQRIEIIGQRKSGETFPVELSIVPIAQDGRYLFSAFIRDITNRKESEAEMAEALEQQKQLSQMRSRFVSMTSHEFRTPLTTIKSSVDLLQFHLQKNLDVHDEKILRYEQRINKEIQRLNMLMNDILLMGKADEGKLDFKPRKGDLYAWLLDLIQNHYLPWKDGRNLELQLKGAPRLLAFDPRILEHILHNLLSNAFKYSPGATAPRLELIYESETVRMVIQDFGVGIPDEEQEMIFSSFYRAGNTGDIQGSGMGLAIVKQFVEIHQGKISYLSNEGEGSRFSLEIPNHL